MRVGHQPAIDASRAGILSVVTSRWRWMLDEDKIEIVKSHKKS
jgi:hypothetical protein